MINICIDGKEYDFEKSLTILEAAKSIGINIPTLCFLKGINKNTSCRICLVEIKGRLVPACDTIISQGMDILTNSKKVRDTRKTILELIAADHNFDCARCIRNGSCELKKLCEIYNVRQNNLIQVEDVTRKDYTSDAIARDDSKCIKCGRCVAVCKEKQNVGVLCYENRAEGYKVTTAFNKSIKDGKCISCGQCSKVCPVGAIYERESLDHLWKVIDDRSKYVIVQIAPAVRVSIAEEFNLDSGDISKKIVTLLKSIGVEKVFDTNFAADLTIMEETNELIKRINNKGKLPLITSCCPGWINYVEKHEPEYISNLSSCKSPQQMFGAIAKTYYAEKENLNAKDIVTVAIMPCTAKKYEANREEFSTEGIKDVDIVLTTRELIRLIKSMGKELNTIEENYFDNPLGTSSGAGAIFGTSGGVMEAALRTAYEKITGFELKELDFYEVRGNKGFKEATINLNNKEVKVAVVNGLENIKTLKDRINKGSNYCFVEVMCCPGGCVGGGGQPYNLTKEALRNRMEKLYKIDERKEIRKSHENPQILKVYKEYLKEPGSDIAEKLLHTRYYNRNK